MGFLFGCFFFSSAVSEEKHDVLRGSHLWRVKILKIKIAEMDVCSVFFNAVDTKSAPMWCLFLSSVVFLGASKT